MSWGGGADWFGCCTDEKDRRVKKTKNRFLSVLINIIHFRLVSYYTASFTEDHAKREEKAGVVVVVFVG